MSGNKAKVIRSYRMPRIKPLVEHNLEKTYIVTVDLGGIDPKAPSAAKILKAFPSAYEAALTKLAKPRNKKNDETWRDAAAEILSGENPIRVSTKTMSFLAKQWKDFADKTLNQVAEETVVKLVNKELGIKESKGVKPKAKYNNDKDTWKEASKVIGGLVGFAGLTISTGGAAALVAIGGGITALVSARKLSEKHYLRAEQMGKRISKECKSVVKQLQSLEPQLNAMEEEKKQLGFLIIKNENEVNLMEKQLKVLELEVSEDRNAKKPFEELKGKYQSLKNALEAEKSAHKRLATNVEKIKKLTAQAQEVSNLVAKDLSNYDNLLKKGEKMTAAIRLIVAPYKKFMKLLP